jgi:hypothetical protein
MALLPPSFFVIPGNPDFSGLPWHLPLTDWQGSCSRLEERQRGLSRHAVAFVNYDEQIFALKELPRDGAKKEFDLLNQIDQLRVPTVSPIGTVNTHTPSGKASVLITRFLERSIPYRSLFMHNTLTRYRTHLLDAMTGLLVQLHVAGVFWGDCSLSNTLFRRDAGALQAYLVDAETAEVYTPRLGPTLRYHDLEIMEENLNGEIQDLAAAGDLNTEMLPLIGHLGANVRMRYQKLWEEIMHEQLVADNERYRIQERIRAINTLGYSVRRLELLPSEKGDKLRLRVMVTDRHFHRDQLYGLTGLEAEERQAEQMMNEILEIKGALSMKKNRSVPLSVAAGDWLEHCYEPVLRILATLLSAKKTSEEYVSPNEMYCQVLEHKWYLSERAHHDVGHIAAAKDFIHQSLDTNVRSG